LRYHVLIIAASDPVVPEKIGEMMLNQNQEELRKIDHAHWLTLYEITQAINSSLDFDEVLHNVMDSVMQITRAQRGFIMVANELTELLEVRVARNPEGENLARDETYSTTVVNQVIASQTSVITNNAQLDPKFSGSNSIMLKGLRAILCAPMMLKAHLVGVVYVDTTIKAGLFTESDMYLLNAVAGQAAIAIENARLYKLAIEKGRLERELQMAREIQQSLLPRMMPRLPGYEVAARWRPAREMAGDFYDLFLVGDTLILVIADVSDKGAAAALCMASTRSMIRAYAFAGQSPQATLSQTNDLLVEDTDSGMFVTAYGSVFTSDGVSHHVNAGHNPPLVYRHRTREVMMMPRGGRALGWFTDNPLITENLHLESGDLILYYTDGVTEAEDRYGVQFGESQLADVLQSKANAPIEDILTSIEQAVDLHLDGEANADDFTLCLVRYSV